MDRHKPWERVLLPCTTDSGSLYVTVKWTGSKLSLTGVEGPKRNGDCRGSCGQVSEPQERKPAKGWDESMIELLWKTWDRWHLNDMKAGCEHQRVLEWKPCPGHYGEDPAPCEGGVIVAPATRGSVRCTADAIGKPCPECGYKYGTAWLHEDVPDGVLSFFLALPGTEQVPAWH